MANRLSSKLQTIYSDLTQPPIPTDDVEDRLRMRLISSFFLFQIVISLGVAFVYLPVQMDPIITNSAIGFGCLSLLCYAISRTPYYKISIYLYIVLTIVALFGLYIATNEGTSAIPEYSLSYLIPVIFFASLLLPIRATLTLIFIILVGVASLPLVISEPKYPSHFLWLFTLITSVLIVVSAMVRLDVFRRLRESENDARNLMEAYIDAVVISSNTKGILAINPAFSELLGYDTDTIIGKTLTSFANNLQSRTLIESNSQRQQKSQPYEVHLSHQNGEDIVVEIINQPHTYNQQPAQVFIIRDVRYVKETLRQHHDQEIRYQSLLELTDDAVFITDFEGVYQAVNQQAADMLGLSVDKLTGKSFHEFIPHAYHTASTRIIERLQEGEAIPMYERTFIKANGHRFPVEVMVHLLRDMNGEPQYIHSVVRDITERKRAEDQRIELAIERERMSTLQEFLRDASHYFRTPLTSLKTSQYLLTQIRDNRQKQDHFLNIMKLEIARLERLISDMMLSTQLEQDSGNGLTFGRLDLAQVLPEIVQTFSPSEKRESYADIIIEPEIPYKTLYVMASRSKLATALYRILENAITYSPPDSKVIIRAYQENQLICIAVKDEGIGIAEDEMDVLFKRFRRADRAVEMAHVGNGLGLFIAQKIVEMHYGEIRVESKPEEGSTFIVSLPMAFRPSKLPITKSSRESM